MMPDAEIFGHLEFLYGEDVARQFAPQLDALMDRWRPVLAGRHEVGDSLALTERDALLITYGDQVTRTAAGGGLLETPLQSLAHFSRDHLRGVITGIHILPFFPYSSDDGFSVIDYRTIDPALGSWDDVGSLGQDFRLMFDAVVNHMSAQSPWFQAFLRDDPAYRDFFVTVDGDPDLSQVVRPRALPLLTEFSTASGPRRVWTTFSADQVDLDFRHPPVLLEILDVLLEYVSLGAHFVRLDAIAYLWKEIGTTSIHLPQTHRVVQLMRSVLDQLAPAVMLITETNVPHTDNISYFGDGHNEAQLVYNFALPPLTLHTFHAGSSAALSRWAASLSLPTQRTTFFNFLASHDGIGVNPARGLLAPDEIAAMVQRVRDHGGLVSYKTDPDGASSPYELNVNCFDALSDPASDEAPLLQINRFMAAQAIMLALAGLPGIYFHSLFGSRGWPEGVALTGRSRTINRQKFDADHLSQELTKPAHRRSLVFRRYRELLAARGSTAAFHPLAHQSILTVGESVFGVLRQSRDMDEFVVCLHNVTSQPAHVTAALGRDALGGLSTLVDLMSQQPVDCSGGQLHLELAPYQVCWLFGRTHG